MDCQCYCVSDLEQVLSFFQKKPNKTKNCVYDNSYIFIILLCYYIMSRTGNCSQKVGLGHILILYLQLVSKTVHKHGESLYCYAYKLCFHFQITTAHNVRKL